ncbi:MAG: hypothetical protein ABSG51_00020 [Terracidiphilus sp.]|jgi:hypothetical protein
MHFDSTTFTSPTVITWLVVALILIVVAIAIAVYQRRKRTEILRSRFGTEYDLILRNEGTRRRAEAAMVTRVRRINHLKIRELTPSERARFIAEWDIVQSRFVDQPRGAVVEADELINSILQTRGYPTAVFEERAADISVHHCNFVGPYRTAHDVTLRAARNEATTEELRNAILHYRALFDELLQITAPAESRALEVGISSHA